MKFTKPVTPIMMPTIPAAFAFPGSTSDIFFAVVSFYFFYSKGMAINFPGTKTSWQRKRNVSQQTSWQWMLFVSCHSNSAKYYAQSNRKKQWNEPMKMARKFEVISFWTPNLNAIVCHCCVAKKPWTRQKIHNSCGKKLFTALFSFSSPFVFSCK